MSFVCVPSDIAMRIVRPEGCEVTFLNNSEIDVYYDREPGRLNASVPGTVPNGTKLSANGGEHTFRNYPCGGIFVRAITITTIEVEP
jgi:hypothetical protein